MCGDKLLKILKDFLLMLDTFINVITLYIRMTRTVEYIYFEAQRPILRCGRSPYNVIRKVTFHVSIDCKYIIINKSS